VSDIINKIEFCNQTLDFNHLPFFHSLRYEQKILQTGGDKIQIVRWKLILIECHDSNKYVLEKSVNTVIRTCWTHVDIR